MEQLPKSQVARGINSLVDESTTCTSNLGNHEEVTSLKASGYQSELYPGWMGFFFYLGRSIFSGVPKNQLCIA